MISNTPFTNDEEIFYNEILLEFLNAHFLILSNLILPISISEFWA